MLDSRRFEKRLKQLEDAMGELADEIASVKIQLMTIRAKYAVGRREEKKKSPTAERVLEELLGGQVLAVSEGKDKQLEFQDTSGDGQNNG